jgi:hypothetical protein
MPNSYINTNKAVNFIIGSHFNIEMIYTVAIFAKSIGINTTMLYQSYAPANIQVDSPFYYSLNSTVKSFINNNLTTIIIVGLNLRYEASLFNTMFRRAQSKHNNFFITMGSFNSLRYTHIHQGNSFRRLLSFIENRVGFVKNRYINQASVAVLLGINSLRGHISKSLQQRVNLLGNQFCVKIGSKDRLGYIHSSISSLAFAHFGHIHNTNLKIDNNFYISIGQPNYSINYFN